MGVLIMEIRKLGFSDGPIKSINLLLRNPPCPRTFLFDVGPPDPFNTTVTVDCDTVTGTRPKTWPSFEYYFCEFDELPPALAHKCYLNWFFPVYSPIPEAPGLNLYLGIIAA